MPHKALRSAVTRMQRALDAAPVAGVSDGAPEVAQCRTRKADVDRFVANKVAAITELTDATAVRVDASSTVEVRRSFQRIGTQL